MSKEPTHVGIINAHKDRIIHLETENEKLRELVWDMACHLRTASEIDGIGWMDARLELRMQELGITGGSDG